MHFAVCSVPFVVCILPFAVCSLQCAVCSVQCIIFRAQYHLICSLAPDDYSLAVVSSVQGQVGVSFDVPSVRFEGCLLFFCSMQCVMCSVHHIVQKI